MNDIHLGIKDLKHTYKRSLYSTTTTTMKKITTLTLLKETKSATMNIFRFFFLFKLFVKVELSYVFTINLFTIARKSELSYKTGVLVIICVPPIIIDSSF